VVGQISTRARSYIRRKATEQMNFECVVERVSGPSLDKQTLRSTAGGREVIYEGPCRIWEVTGGATFNVAEEEYSLQNTNLSIPWDADPVPITDDEVQILDAPTDPHMVGRRYRIVDVAKAGELRATRRFQVQGIQENESWQR
jgi:hypothetical protein